VLTARGAVLDRAENLHAPLVQDMDELAAGLSDAECDAIGRYLTTVAELTERHAERLDRQLRQQQRELSASPTPGLST